MLKVDKTLKIGLIAVIIYIIYIYASIIYDIPQIFWLLVLILLAGAFTIIFFKDVKEVNSYPLRLIPYYLIISVFVFIRYLMLGYPVKPIGRGLMTVGAALVTFIFLLKVVRLNKTKQFKTKAVHFVFVFLCSIFVGLLVYFLVNTYLFECFIEFSFLPVMHHADEYEPAESLVAGFFSQPSGALLIPIFDIYSEVLFELLD